MLSALGWGLLIELMGALALPLAFTVFHSLPDRGYAFAKVLGVLLSAWAIWFVGMLGLPFTQLNSWIVFVVLFGGLNVWLLLRQRRQLLDEILDFVGSKIWLIIVMEMLFVVVYAYALNLHSYAPAANIRNTEKPGDFEILNSLIVGTKLPPTDLWMSGYTVNYYYFGHFVFALLAKMMGTNPAVAFDLSIPLIMGLMAFECFGIVYNLVSVARRLGGFIVGALGILAAMFVNFVGNLDSLRQILAPNAEHGETGLNNFQFSTWYPSRVIWDYMPIPNGNGINWTYQETINEFPFFSYLLADMHPHVMSLPFMGLAIGLALNLAFTQAGSNSYNLRRVEGGITWFVLALSLGAFIFLNTWDFPTYTILVLMVAALAEFRAGPTLVTATGNWFNQAVKLFALGGTLPEEGLAWGRVVRFLGFAVRVVVLSVILYLPFLLTFTSLVGNNPLPDALDIPLISTIGHLLGVVAWNRTPLYGYLLVFGVFVFPVVSYLFLKAWPYLKDPYSYFPADYNPEIDPVPAKFSVSLNTGISVIAVGLIILVLSEACYFVFQNPIISVGLGLIADPIVAIGAGLLLAYVLEKVRSIRPAVELRMLLVALGLLMMGFGYYQHMELYGPLIICVTFAVLMLIFENAPRPLSVTGIHYYEADRSVGVEATESYELSGLRLADNFALLVLTLVGTIDFLCEVFFLRDEYNSRLNTLFKFYYQSWVMYGLISVYCIWRIGDFAWNLRVRQLERQTFDIYEPIAEAEAELAEAESVATVEGEEVEAEADDSGELAAVGTSQTEIQEATATNYPAYRGYYSASRYAPSYAYGSAADSGDLDDEEFDPAWLLSDEDKVALEEVAVKTPGQKQWWRWLWAFAMFALVLAGLIYTVLGPYTQTGHFADRQGLNGIAWYQQEYPADYAAVIWLQQQAKDDPNFKGTILEATGGDWTDYSLVASYSGYPTVMGWWGHEIQWRGGKEDTRDEANARYYVAGTSVDTIYSTTDVNLAQQLLKKYNVKYVYVGEIETGAASPPGQQPKQYSQAALQKFAQFMHPIYNSGGVIIYSF